MARHRAALIARNAAGLRLRIDPPALRQSRFADKRTGQVRIPQYDPRFPPQGDPSLETAIAARQNDGNVDRAGKPLRVGGEERLSIEVAHTAVPPVPAHFYSRRAVSRQQLRRFNAVVLSQAALPRRRSCSAFHDQRERRLHSGRTASTTSTRKRARFRRAPPYSSRRLLSKGLKNWLSR